MEEEEAAVWAAMEVRAPLEESLASRERQAAAAAAAVDFLGMEEECSIPVLAAAAAAGSLEPAETR